MKKKILWGGLVAVLLAVGAWALYSSNMVSERNASETQAVEGQPQSSAEEKAGEGSMGSPEAVDASKKNYEISEGSEVYYVAQKKFFNKPVLEVVGKTGDVSGQIYVLQDNTTYGVLAEIKPTFTTDSSVRDADVRSRFKGSIFIKALDQKLPSALSSSEQTFAISLDVAINGVDRRVDFDITARETKEDAIEIAGKAAVKMTDFDIEPPSALNIFTVEDDIEIGFTIQARRSD